MRATFLPPSHLINVPLKLCERYFHFILPYWAEYKPSKLEDAEMLWTMLTTIHDYLKIRYESTPFGNTRPQEFLFFDSASLQTNEVERKYKLLEAKIVQLTIQAKEEPENFDIKTELSAYLVIYEIFQLFFQNQRRRFVPLQDATKERLISRLENKLHSGQGETIVLEALIYIAKDIFHVP